MGVPRPLSGLGSYAAAIALFSALQAYGLFDELWLRALGLVLVALGTTFMVTGLIVSLMRYRLYDADAVIGRSAAYGVLTLAFVALFAGGEKVIEVVGERYFGEGLGVSAAGLAAGVAAALIVPMHHRVGRWAEHRFQRALIRLREGVPLLVGDMRETASPGGNCSRSHRRDEHWSPRNACCVDGGRRRPRELRRAAGDDQNVAAGQRPD